MPIDHIHFLKANHRAAFPILAPAFARLTVSADVVLCSSSGWSHMVTARGLKAVYCHTPARWLYRRQEHLGGTVGPVLLSVGPAAVRVGSAARAAELAALLAAVFAAGVLAFDPFGFGLPQVPVTFVPLVVLVWVGLRYRVWAASVAVLILSGTAALGTARIARTA